MDEFYILSQQESKGMCLSQGRLRAVCLEFYKNRRCSKKQCRLAHPPPLVRISRGQMKLCQAYEKSACIDENCENYHRVEDDLDAQSSEEKSLRSVRNKSKRVKKEPRSAKLVDVCLRYLNSLRCDRIIEDDVTPDEEMVGNGVKKPAEKPPRFECNGIHPTKDNKLQKVKVRTCLNSGAKKKLQCKSEYCFKNDAPNIWAGKGQRLEVCEEYVRGSCKRGRACKFAHPLGGNKRLFEHVNVCLKSFGYQGCYLPNCAYYHPPPHIPMSMVVNGRLELCFDFWTGKCHNTKCDKAHTKTDKEVANVVVQCEDFTLGKCQKGDDCIFYHGFSTRHSSVCFEYMNRWCHRGNACRYEHSQPNTSSGIRSSIGMTPPLSATKIEVVSPRNVSRYPGNNVPVCLDYLNRGCLRGRWCRFVHREASTSGMGSSMGMAPLTPRLSIRDTRRSDLGASPPRSSIRDNRRSSIGASPPRSSISDNRRSTIGHAPNPRFKMDCKKDSLDSRSRSRHRRRDVRQSDASGGQHQSSDVAHGYNGRNRGSAPLGRIVSRGLENLPHRHRNSDTQDRAQDERSPRWAERARARHVVIHRGMEADGAEAGVESDEDEVPAPRTPRIFGQPASMVTEDQPGTPRTKTSSRRSENLSSARTIPMAKSQVPERMPLDNNILFTHTRIPSLNDPVECSPKLKQKIAGMSPLDAFSLGWRTRDVEIAQGEGQHGHRQDGDQGMGTEDHGYV